MKWFKKNNIDSDEDSPETDAELMSSGDDEEGQLALDVYQDKDNVIVKSTIAGVRPDGVDIGISDGVLTIRGERKQEEDVDEKDYFFQECYWGVFSRSVRLPVAVDSERAEADIKDGILTVILPKVSGSRTKKVRVRGEG